MRGVSELQNTRRGKTETFASCELETENLAAKNNSTFRLGFTATSAAVNLIQCTE